MDKLFAPLAGKPLLSHTLAAFEACPQVERIVVVLAEENLERGRRLMEGLIKVVALCRGGEQRQDSVAAGLRALGPCSWVVVHDGARPLVTPQLIEGVLLAARATGAATAAIPIADTVKEVGKDRTVVRTLRREGLWAVQTPQVFRYDLLLRAHGAAREEGWRLAPPLGPASRHARIGGEVTDDAALVERLGHPVRVFPGSPRNIKVTTAGDLALAEALLRIQLQGG